MGRLHYGTCPCGGDVTGTYRRQGERTKTMVCGSCSKRKTQSGWKETPGFAINPNLSEILIPNIRDVLREAEGSRTASTIAKTLGVNPQVVGRRLSEMDRAKCVKSSGRQPRYVFDPEAPSS